MKLRDLIGVTVGGLIACGATSAGDDVLGAMRGIDGVRLETIGTSGEGRDLVMARLGDPAGGRAVLVVAGLHPHHEVGVQTALGLLEAAAEDPDALEGAALYVLPLANPDGRAWWRRDGTPRVAFAGTIGSNDADRDGRIDEDGPADLNADGAITMMRIERPSVSTGLRATHIEDPELPGFMREADASAGEVARYAMLVESADVDGDGRFGEDGIFGVTPDRNFPYQWPEFEDDAGRHQLSSPEAHALATWLLAHPEVRAVVTYGPHDTVTSVPKVGKHDQTGAVPLGIESGDEALYKAVSERFRSLTGIKKTDPSPSNAGSFHGWTYGHLGLYTFATPVWVRPDMMEPIANEASEDAPDADAGDEANERDEDAADEKPWAPPKDASAEAAWWSYLRDVRAGAGIVEWTPFDHPQLGAVEIGGAIPGHRFDVPQEVLPILVEGQTAFVMELASALAQIEQELAVESLGGGLWRVDLRVRNDGRLPTRSAMGSKARREPPMVFVMDVPDEQLVSGGRLQRIDRLDGHGASRDLSWIVRGGAGESVRMRVRLPGMEERAVTVRLTEESR